ncbi:hypothetical protein [Megasphaera sp. UBA4382]|uniref:hypothetical protein n=1 Tax=Megasphaera sp. UBA4382 TaxID=1946850 RepID=UPI0025C4695D|nr:hypothetical protein [Megasphaera sp. UBA4382]
MMAERYILQFPRGIAITIFPHDMSEFHQFEFWEGFREQIKKSFRDYTKGTNPEYIVEDKLSFINLIRELNFKISGRQIVNEHIREEFDDKNEVYLEDISDTDSIEEMIDEGLYRYKKDWNRWSGDKHVDEMVCALVADAIKTVMEYPELEIQSAKKRGE